MKIKLYKENFAVLFHHFHKKDMFYESPGSLTKNKFHKFIQTNKNKIINADIFLKNFKKKNKLVCLSFDDGLKCQYNLALPILKKENLKAFFFIPTSNFSKNKLSVETVRYFKYKHFKNIDDFYFSFFEHFKKIKVKKFDIYSKYKKLIKKINKESPYYSKLDIEHKIIRDHIINEANYNNIILSMMKEKKLNINKLNKKLLMTKNDIIKILKMGHIVGLHSHSHSYKFHNLNFNQEFREYKKNKFFLEKFLKSKINVASYPFGYQTKNTIKILKKLSIKYAFNKNFIKKNKTINKLDFNISRENISNIVN